MPVITLQVDKNIMMEDVKNKLSELLSKSTWTEEEKNWLLKYLERPETTELQELMQEQFDENIPLAQIDPNLSRQMLQGIHQRLGIENQVKKASVVRLWALRIAAAASILFMIGLGWKLLHNKKSDAPTVAQESSKLKDTLLAVVRHEVNTSGKEKRVQLPDGSMIVLADKSEITYREPFTNKRDIILIGKAYFKVAKDKTKPFTVISGDISTTALGTEFTVTAFENASRITVRLYEGKVVVKPVANGNQRLKKDVYLLPGQEFVYDSKTTAQVKTFKLNDAASPEVIMNEELSRDNPSVPQNAEGTWYMFNNQSLTQVFDQLAEMYKVEIVYDKKDVQNMYFIGKFDKSRSLEIILQQIGTLNNLTVTKKDSVFIISK
ncbi:MAG: FecR family protein [Flavisolibacter sp.]|nr:FecR family protein [Flavisolibacter sp.]